MEQKDPTLMRRRFPSSFYNALSLAGVALASLSFGLIIFLVILEFFTAQHKPYVGILAFIILPAFLFIGLLLIAYGIWRKHRQEQSGTATEFYFPRLDLNDPKHFRATVIFSGVTLLLLLSSAFGSFKAYEYTDSDEFCGTMCHSVMEPEYTAYQSSPHARVGCVKCHIGPGAGWFVRSKLSGAYQVYATLLNKFPRPIPTPIENLRPAQETCEQCHWPQHFFSEKYRTQTYYLSDEKSERWSLGFSVKVGGGNADSGPTSGIHWHMNIANEITYAPLDTQRLIIPWVKVRNKKDGTIRIYRSTEQNLSDTELQKIETRQMDCIDCHNRPSHIYHPPARSVNHVIELGWISRELPSVKGLAVNVLEQQYSSKSVALDSIRLFMEEYYRHQFPQLASTKSGEIGRAIKATQDIYRRNYFPEMRHDWRQYPDNIGHMYYPGCFRCHDGKHVSEEGKVISRDCNICHTLISQQYADTPMKVSITGLDYRHPVDIGDSWKEMNCSDCHAAKR